MEMRKRFIITPDVTLGFLAWQNVLEQLQTIEITNLEKWKQTILQDLMNLLIKKGFERFRGFHSGIQANTLSDNAYSFKGKAQSQSNINWPINSTIQEGNYVFNK
jgi:hypothetical protein